VAQAAVERCIGRLLTDEGARARFRQDPEGTLAGIVTAAGLTLTATEREVLSGVASAHWDRLAEGIDPRLQRLSAEEEPRR
jgi:hypothetical protein